MMPAAKNGNGLKLSHLWLPVLVPVLLVGIAWGTLKGESSHAAATLTRHEATIAELREDRAAMKTTLIEMAKDIREIKSDVKELKKGN